MKKLKFEKIDLKAFETLDKKRMKNVKGGYTGNTFTVYGGGGGSWDGNDGITND